MLRKIRPKCNKFQVHHLFAQIKTMATAQSHSDIHNVNFYFRWELRLPVTTKYFSSTLYLNEAKMPYLKTRKSQIIWKGESKNKSVKLIKHFVCFIITLCTIFWLLSKLLFLLLLLQGLWFLDFELLTDKIAVNMLRLPKNWTCKNRDFSFKVQTAVIGRKTMDTC